MKDRSKKPRLVSNAKRTTPTKFDPTRTTTLRRAFVGKIRRKFAMLRKAIYDLLVTEDALGLKKNLTYNAFCPTGPGGGVDPSCSPVGSGVSSEEWANSISPKEKHLVQEYLRSASWVKATQVAPEFFDQDRINEVKEFEQAILKAPLFKGNIHRGLGGLTEEQVKSFVPGSIISMDSTSSWTKDKHVAEAFVELRKNRSIEGHKGVVLTVKDSKFTHDIEGIGSGAKLAAETLSIKGSKYKVVSVSDINHVEPFPTGHPTSGFQKPSNYKHVVLEEIANSITTNHKPIKYVKLSDFTITIVTNHIEKLPSGKYRLLSHTGNNLGTFDSHEEAAKHEGEVEYFKHVSNERWRFNTTPEQLEAFKEWLKTQVDYYVTGMTDEELWRKFIESGFKKGAGRAFDDTKPQAGWTEAEGAFYAGTKDQFLKSAFGQPESLSKVQLLAARTFDELEGMSADMQNKLGRILVDGLTKGNGPISIAREMSNQLNLSMTRAETIARTELIRAHAEGQLVGMEELGVDEVGVMVEWSTAGDDRVCFPAGTMVKTSRGDVPIELITKNDLVVTRQGFKKVSAVSKRNYSGKFTTIDCDSKQVTATSSHKFWTQSRGWVSADQLTLNDSLDVGGDRYAKITCIFNHGLRYSNNLEPMTAQYFVTPDITSRVSRMPIVTIAFNDNSIVTDEQEINRVPPDFSFLSKFDLHADECLSDFLFDRSLGIGFSVAGKTAVSSITLGGLSEFLRTSNTTDYDWWSSTQFRAVLDKQPSNQVRIFDEYDFPTGSAVAFSTTLATSKRAVIHTMLEGLTDCKLPTTCDAVLCNYWSSRYITSSGAEPPAFRFTSNTSINDFATDRAWYHSASLFARRVAKMRTEFINRFDSSSTDELDTAERTQIIEWHDNPCQQSSSTIPVYCVQVSELPEFYANGMLVHNCDLCEPMEGVVLKIEEARGMIPRHPNCRCAFVPANVAEPTDDQKRGKRKIMSAVRTSAALGKDDFSTAVPVTKERLKSVLPVIANAFCPTGPGGGQDNSCSPFSTSAVDFGDDVSKQYKDAPKIRVTDEDVSNVKAALKQRGMLNKDGTVTLYHDTIDDPETIASILKHGLIPSAQPAPGQTWKATHSSYSTYFHQDPSAARGLQSTAADEFLTTIEARIPVTKEFLKRVIPDEESGGVHEGVVQLISGAGAPAVIGGVPAKYLSSRKYSKPTEPKPTKTSRTTHPHEDSILQAAGELNGSKYKGRLSIGERISSKLYKESGKKINLSGAEVNEVLKQHSSELSKYGISINTQPAPSVVYQFSQLLAGARK